MSKHSAHCPYLILYTPTMAIYLKNKNLLHEYHRSMERGEMTPELVKMFELLVNRISSKFYYRIEEDRKDAKQNALYHLCRSWHKFNPERSDNPFAYYTQIAKMGFAQGWNQLYWDRKGYVVLSLDREGGNGESNFDMI